MESFDTEATFIAHFFKFAVNTLEVRTMFADEDEYLESMEADLGIKQGWAADDNNFDKSPKITLEEARDALQQTLWDRPDDLESSHRDGLSYQSDITHSTGNSTLNNEGAAQGPARKEEALKSLSLIKKNSELTEELVEGSDWFAEVYRLFEDSLWQFELGDAQPPTLLTNNAKMVVKGTRVAGKVPCSGDAN